MVTQDNGWLVRPGDADSLTATLRVALARPDRLAAMGRASHRLAVERFNLDTMVDVFVAALRGSEGPG
jgi:glycosyltransferase involved in cell wall biosynthesis